MSATTLTPASMASVAERIHALDPHRTLDDVAADLLAIEHERGGFTVRRSLLGRRRDGVACFNFMYLRVTQAVRDSAHTFEDPEFVQRLAVVFAQFYLDAYAAAKARAWVSKAWQPLFEDRRRRDIVPLQFALAGMNAHINNDLTWALLQTWEELGDAAAPDSPRYRDFQRINDILAQLAPGVRKVLESGFLRWLDRFLGRWDDLFASFVIAKARDEAWTRGERWRTGVAADAAEAHERSVGFESHLILAA
jgi:hypothetical protein